MADELKEDREALAKSKKLEAVLKERARLLDRRISEEDREQAKLEKDIEAAKRQRSKLMKKGYCFDGCSVPLVLKLVLLDARAHGWSGTLTSADRTSEFCDACGDKSSQEELYQAYLNGTGAPANPPGTGSHEYRNGGNGGTPAYASLFPVGAKLPAWALGLDVGDGGGLVVVLNRLGYKAHRPYMPREPWHVNLSENPKERLIDRGLV
jgi:hypothetical protein